MIKKPLIIPEVYGQALSYYEELENVLKALQETLDEIASNAESITAETQARTEADKKLQDKIDAEAQKRASGDTSESQERKKQDEALTSKITEETASRIAGDNSLQENINAEKTTRENIDASLDDKISEVKNNLQEEVTNRTNEDTNLLSKITDEEEARIEAIKTESNARTSADNAINSKIAVLKIYTTKEADSNELKNIYKLIIK